MYNPSAHRSPEAGRSDARMAGDAPAWALGLLGPESPLSQITKSRYLLPGAATLWAVADAANKANNPDPQRSDLQNAVAPVASGVGTLGGSLGGALLARILGGALGVPLGPVGSAVGATLGGLLGGPVAEKVASAAVGAFEGTPEQKALELAKKQGELAIQLQADKAKAMLPLEAAAARQMHEMQQERLLSMQLGELVRQSGLSADSSRADLMRTIFGGAG